MFDDGLFTGFDFEDEVFVFMPMRTELMLLGLISLMLSQTARWISEICVPSSLFSSRFYICSEGDFTVDDVFGSGDQTPLNHSTLVGWKLQASSQQCGPVSW